MHVHIQNEPDKDARRVLEETLDDGIELSFGAQPPGLNNYSILVAGRPEPELLEAGIELNTLVIPFAGLPKSTAELLADYPDIAVHNLHHNAPATAELALALLLAATKSVVPIDARFRKGDWSDRGQMDRARQLDGGVALVLGYGAIGKRVAKALSAMGMEVLAVARRKRADSFHEPHTPDSLPDLLPRADVLVICLPETGETRGLLGAEQLALLPAHAVLVNVARGAIIEEQALFDALKSKRIFAAGLDVWWKYPGSRDEWGNTPPSALPFHELDNVVLSPHRGGHVSDTEQLRMRALGELLNAAVRGDEIPNRVDMKAGY
ncbi:MAG: hydroxyacid dehydrogenase [Planctomycetes bacterium]|nr:hydroxyacid dehydrogenase [Planctomycetota bacterium]